MPIIWDPNRRLINIETKTSTYQMKIDEYNNLIHTHYGGKIGDSDMSSEIVYLDRGFSGNPYEAGKKDRTYSLDYLPQEYSCFGTGDFRITGLHVKEANGSKVCSLHYKNHYVCKGLYSIKGLPRIHGNADDDNYETLFVEMTDEVSGLDVTLIYSVIYDLDIIGRSARLRNNGNELLTIEKAASMNLDIPYGNWQWIRYIGRHAMERNIVRSDIYHGVQSVGSVRGTSSHHYQPFSIICKKETNETAGECYGFSFVYSGEHITEIEKDQTENEILNDSLDKCKSKENDLNTLVEKHQKNLEKLNNQTSENKKATDSLNVKIAEMTQMLNSSGSDLSKAMDDIIRIKNEAKEMEMKESLDKLIDLMLTNIENEITKEKMVDMNKFNLQQMTVNITNLKSIINTLTESTNSNNTDISSLKETVDMIKKRGLDTQGNHNTCSIKITMNQMLNNVEFTNIYSLLRDGIKNSPIEFNEDMKAKCSELVDNKIKNELEKIKNVNQNMWINAC